jgi:large subunit ribosomal protein L24
MQVLFNERKQLWYVVVEGLNTIKKHVRTREKGKPGQILTLSAPLAMSKVMLIDSDGKPTRVGYSIEGGKKVRISKRTKQVIS